MKSKLAVIAIALLFAAGFGAGGAFGISSLVGHLNGWWEARSWQPATATVLDASLKESQGDDSTTYQAIARYRYVIDERVYEGTRVGFSRGYDNVGSWQRERYTQLDAAKRGNRPITIWVDPENPERSTVDRELRWGMIAFSLPFAILFPLISLGAVWVLIHTIRTPSAEFGTAKPPEANAARIKSDARRGIGGLWFFAIFWNSIALPLGFLFIPELFGRSWLWLLVALFPAVGIVLFWMAVANTVRFRRNGEATIVLSPIQPRLGEALSVRVQFEREPPEGEYKISLQCQEVDTRGEDTRYNTVWRQERSNRATGSALTGMFSPGDGLPASEPETQIYHRWRVLLNFPDGKDERAFDVTLNAAQDAGGQSPQSEPVFVDALADDVAAQPVPEHVATVTDEFSRLRIDYQPAYTRRIVFMICLFGSIFAGIGGFLMFGDTHRGAMPFMMGLIFGAAGVGVIAAGVYALTHRRSVEIARQRVRIDNRWLLNSKQDEFAASEIVGLSSRVRGTSSIGRKHYDHHEIVARLRDGREIRLASDIYDDGVVATLLRLHRHHLGLGTERAAATIDGDAAERAGVPTWVRWLAPGTKILGALLLAAFLWDFVTPFVFEKPPRPSARTEADNSEREQRGGLSAIDRVLFDAISQDRSLEEISAALTRGANIYATNEWGATPLIVAARNAKPETIDRLLQAGADVNYAVTVDNDYRGRTALMNAAFGGNEAGVKALLIAGANAGAFERHGWSALHYAAHRGDVAVLLAFRGRGIDLDIRSPESRGETPLMLAARFGKVAAINKLIELGADPRAKDRHGENVYGWAKYFNQPAAMEALQAYR